MPFKAILNDIVVNALDVPRDEWRSLRGTKYDVRMLCCGEKGHCRTSKLGTQHFYHARKGTTAACSETEEHRECKRIIYETAKSEGYKAEIEATGNGWRADVLVKTGEQDYAFEVQLSRQALDETLSRSRALLRDGKTPVWLMKPPMELAVEKRVPAFGLLVSDLQNPIVTDLQRRRYSLADFVSTFLKGEVDLNADPDSLEEVAYVALLAKALLSIPWWVWLLGGTGLLVWLDAVYRRR